MQKGLNPLLHRSMPSRFLEICLMYSCQLSLPAPKHRKEETYQQAFPDITKQIFSGLRFSLLLFLVSPKTYSGDLNRPAHMLVDQ